MPIRTQREIFLSIEKLLVQVRDLLKEMKESQPKQGDVIAKKEKTTTQTTTKTPTSKAARVVAKPRTTVEKVTQ